MRAVRAGLQRQRRGAVDQQRRALRLRGLGKRANEPRRLVAVNRPQPQEQARDGGAGQRLAQRGQEDSASVRAGVTR